MFRLSQHQNEGPTVLSEVWSCESKGRAFDSIEVHGHRASELVRRHINSVDSPLYSLFSPIRKQILDSKSHKRLQELNLALDKQATVLDDERTILATILRDYLAGMALEQALHELCAELTVLEAQDVMLRQQITQEMKNLSLVEQKVGKIQSRFYEVLILRQIARVSGSDDREGKTAIDTM
jgi:hypothetical protein